jgi:tetratricopeptide (TPR) repeat protein
MALGPYSPCPCGSGKQFKWCCGPIYAGIERALEQESNGQHETALRLINDVVAAHPTNPEAWGQKARLLWLHQKPDEAEEALGKAFEINPNYPFGLLMQAQFRWEEGEVAGALLLARRAAEAYAPEALDFLFEVYSLIFEAEIKMQRPVAAHAALRIASRCQPAHEGARDALQNLFGEQGNYPACARREYTLLSPDASVSGERRTAWTKALSGATTPRLGDLARMFEQLSKADSTDAAAWYNLGVARAWLGDNAAALEALQRYLELKPSDEQAAVGAALMEVLRFGVGLSDQSDYQEWSFAIQLRGDVQPLGDLLAEWQRNGQLLVPQAPDQNGFFGLVLDTNPAGIITTGPPVSDTAALAGYIALVQNLVRVWGLNKAAVERLREAVRKRLNLPIGEAQLRSGSPPFHEVVAEALLFPTRPNSSLTAEKLLEHAGKFYEEKWVHQPRRALSGNTPLEAAKQPVLRRKLLGVIQFMQDCAERTNLAAYDWDRLRRVLGLISGASTTPAATPGPADGVGDISSLGEAELAALPDDTLSFEQLEQAYQSAQKLNAENLSARFARALVAQPQKAEKPDRYPWFLFLVQKALRDGDTTAALDYVNEGEKMDCEHNGGQRRNDYQLRRGQVHVKRGEADQAQDVFQKLIERVPAELRYRVNATEAMLSLKQGAKALKFAEEGIAKARQQQQRDAEQHLMELAAAARKMG